MVTSQCLVFIYIICLTSLTTASRSERSHDDLCPAPPPCTCEGFRIFCSNLNLTEVPVFRKPDPQTKEYAWDVNLGYNNLKHVPGHAFEILGNIYGVNLNNNALTTIATDAFAGSEETINRIFISNNRLSGIPAAFGQLKKLSMLDIEHNPLTSYNEAVLKNISNSLTSLFLGSPDMTYWPTELQLLKSLRYLELDSVPFDTLPGNALLGLESLATLSLQQTKLKEFPSSNITIEKLVSISMYNNTEMSDGSFKTDSFLGMPNLAEIYITNMSLSKVPDFSRVTSLETISISYCNIKSWSDSSTLPAKGNLTSIGLSNMPLSEIPHVLKGIKTLQDITISGTEISEIKTDYFAGLRNLTSLFIGSNPIADLKEDVFKDNTMLKRLDLSFTNITTFPKAVEDLINIEQLYMSGDNITCSCEAMGWINRWVRSDKYWYSEGECSNISGVSLQEYILTDVPKCPVKIPHEITLIGLLK